MPVLVFGDSTVAARIMSHLSIDSSTSCWIFTGTRDRNGYGSIRCGPRMKLAHRVAYVVHKGEIPEGMQIDHLCRHRACCNPDHLEAVTRHENWRRSRAVTRLNQLATHCKQGHALSGTNLLRTTSGHRKCRICQRRSQAAYKARRRAQLGA